MVTVIDDPIEDFTEDGDSDVEIIENPSSQSSNRKPRPTRAIAAVLPDWVQDSWKTVIIPTLLDIVGQCDNVWTIEKGDGDAFRDRLQDVIDDVHPYEHYEVIKTGPIYQKVSIFFVVSDIANSLYKCGIY